MSALVAVAVAALIYFVVAFLLNPTSKWGCLFNIYRLNVQYQEFFSELSNDGGLGTILFYVGLAPIKGLYKRCVLVRDPRFIKTVYLYPKKFNRIGSEFVKSMKEAIGTNIITGDDEHWKYLRPTYEKYFEKWIRNFFYTTAEVVQKIGNGYLQEKVAKGETVDVADLSNLVAGSAAFCSFLGIESADVDMINDTLTVFEFIRNHTISLLPVPSLNSKDPKIVHVRKCRENVYNKILKMVDVHREDDSMFGDIIRRAEEKYSGDQSAINTAIAEETISMLIGGMETTAITLSWICYYLSKHPLIQEKVRREIKGCTYRGNLQYNDINMLTYTNNVITEVLRLHSPATMSCLQVMEDNTELDGITLHSGDLVFMSQYVNHRLDSLWTDPLTFNPDRYENQSNGIIDSKQNLHTFGGGKFVCVGRKFSINEALLLTTMLLEKYEIKLDSGSDVIDIKVTARPRDRIKIKLLPLEVESSG